MTRIQGAARIQGLPQELFSMGFLQIHISEDGNTVDNPREPALTSLWARSYFLAELLAPIACGGHNLRRMNPIIQRLIPAKIILTAQYFQYAPNTLSHPL